jgi:type I restriction enzyme S subunit
MKDSGVEWIGEVPAHWEVKQLKYLAKVVLGKMLQNSNLGNYELKPYLKSKNIQWLSVDVSSVDEMWFSKKEMDEYRLLKGDLVLSEGGEVGKTCIWNNELAECYIQNSAHKVRFYSGNKQEYFLYLFFTAGKMGHFEKIINRVSIGHLTKDKLTNCYFVQPPITEQEQIIEHIENTSTKIATAITIKEQEIEKLKEYKTTLINAAVTGKIKV